MSERVSDELLQEIATYPEDIARELLALRASHNALYEALNDGHLLVCMVQVGHPEWHKDYVARIETKLGTLLDATEAQLQGAAEQP